MGYATTGILIDNCKFIKNQAGFSGGSIYMIDSKNLIIKNS